MGVLLKEALRRLCVDGGWSYAMFWKIGQRNPAHLVWAEGHNEMIGVSGLLNLSRVEIVDPLCKEQQSGQDPLKDRIGRMVNKMMIPQVHVVGSGIIGCAALTGNHQWIFRETLGRDGCSDAGSLDCRLSSKDLAELNQQFLTGIQTIAIIPVLPHGVVQLGSTQMVMESIRFVNHVKILFAQLASVPGALLSENIQKALGQKVHVNASYGVPTLTPLSMNTHSELAVADSFDRQALKTPQSGLAIHSSYASPSINALEVLSTSKEIMTCKDKSLGDSVHTMPSTIVKSLVSRVDQVESGSTKAKIVHPHPSVQLKQEWRSIVSSGLSVASSVKDSVIVSLLGENESSNNINNLGTSDSLPSDAWKSVNGDSFLESIMVPSGQSSDIGTARILNPANRTNNDHVTSEEPQRDGVSSMNKHTTVALVREQEIDALQTNNIQSIDSDDHPSWLWSMPGFLEECSLIGSRVAQGDQSCHDVCAGVDMPTPSDGDTFCRSGEISDALVRPPMGDELFEALSQGFKSNRAYGSLNDVNCKVDVDSQNLNMEFCTSMTEIDKGVSDIISETHQDHLLEAVVSKVHSSVKQNSEDSVSCKTTLTNISSASPHTSCPSYGWVSSEEKLQKGLVALSPSLVKVDAAISGSVASACSIGTVGDYSQMAGGYKSRISLWGEGRQQEMKVDNISATQSGKSNRKRTRPGENPRPRPKDRQMIQDRVKELREIVPNGAKCSIDSLLERTIKHMLFLQSVTKHADKLKETGEPKIKEGGLVLKDNFEGGATWAFEVGTQSMICPIIVEDLNPPRQMLVEMLCEERGFFLEIADLIRGLGLTILKGVMEARNNKVWACFAVEANSDVTRMEIFLSLVRILEPTMGSSSLVPKDLIIGDNVGLNAFHQPSIPATGMDSRMC
ncbi:Transcription factor LHW [Acorus calamus]|uniref:Transcription factor LHW n=1 Tax=Acorus calamus TaxID=4465 RepID=A0AAV9DGR7_ACOCL|nr:Transcription factor LHW [Acorus calamus]